MSKAGRQAVFRPTDDHRVREVALDVERSFIVQAPAGSGKTELLTKRFLKLLSRVERPERVLAITFTRKATQEMRKRVMQRLQQAAGEGEVKPEEQGAVELARKVLGHDAKQGWHLRENPGRLRILTIDGLCTELVSRSAGPGSGVAGLRVLEDARPIYRRAVRRLFEDLDDPKGLAAGALWHDRLLRVLAHLDGDAQRLEDLLCGMLAIRDQWTSQLVHAQVSMQQILRERQIVELDAFRSSLGEKHLARAEQLTTLLGQKVSDVSAPAAVFARLPDPGEEVAARLWRCHYLSGFLCTQGGEPRGRGGINAKLFPGIANGDRALLTELSEIYQGWFDRNEAQGAIRRMANYPPLDAEPGRQGLLEDVLKLLQMLALELESVMQEEARTDFAHIAQAALQALAGPEEDDIGSALLAEDQRLEHLLIDEFQDTSHTQHRLIERLLQGWQPGDGRTLFLVGDPMQSIYRFREADVGLFTRVVNERRLGDVVLERLELTANFRSHPEIVDWANSTFAPIFPSTDRHDAGAVRYHPAVAEREPGGAEHVHLHALTPDEGLQHEAMRVVDLVNGYLESDTETSIAVLVRARKHLGTIAGELTGRGIAFDAVQIDALGDRPVIQDLLAITRLLVHPADRVAWMALLRAPWCGLRVRDLHRVVGADPGGDVLRLIEAAISDDVLSPTDRERLAVLYASLVAGMAMRASHGLRQCVEYAWLCLGGPRCYAGPEELENAATFLGLLQQLERESPIELFERLEESLERLFAQGRSSRVQLMTIHKAKGLEFDVVILPGLERSTGNSTRPLILAQQFSLSADPTDGEMGPRALRDGVLMATVPPRGAEGPSLYGYLQAVDAERQGYESQRLLYVAATRAKSHLHLFGQFEVKQDGSPSARSGTFLKLLLPAFEKAINERHYQPTEAVEERQEPPVLPLLRLRELPRCRAVLAPPGKPMGALRLASRDAAAMGEALHQVLELAHDHWDRGWPLAWFEQHRGMLESLLLRAGAAKASLSRLVPELLAMIAGLLAADPGRQVVSPAGKADSHAELMMLERNGNRVSRHIIDRIWRDGDGGWVIADYKTGEDTDSVRAQWLAQLERYCQLLQRSGLGEVSGKLILQAGKNQIIDLSREREP